MPRKLAPLAIASAIASAIPATAFAIDVDPYFEFEVRRKNGPTTYLTDVNQAASELIAVACEEKTSGLPNPARPSDPCGCGDQR